LSCRLSLHKPAKPAPQARRPDRLQQSKPKNIGHQPLPSGGVHSVDGCPAAAPRRHPMKRSSGESHFKKLRNQLQLKRCAGNGDGGPMCPRVVNRRARPPPARRPRLRAVERAPGADPTPTSSCTCLMSWMNLGTVSMRSSGRNQRYSSKASCALPMRARLNKSTDSRGNAFTSPATQPTAPAAMPSTSRHPHPRRPGAGLQPGRGSP